MEKISISELNERMSKGVVKFAYIENGSTQVVNGTTKAEFTKSQTGNGLGPVSKFEHNSYWNTDKNEWCQFFNEAFIGVLEDGETLNEALLNKHTLKQQIYSIYDMLDREVGKLMSPGCEDEETGELRSEVYSILNKAAAAIKEVGHGIY